MAFNKCLSLERVKLNEGLEEIGEFCFDCAEIGQIAIPGSVRRIQTYAFNWCKALHRVVFEEDSRLEELGDNAFAGRADLIVYVKPGMRFDLDSRVQKIAILRLPRDDTMVGDYQL